MLNRTPLTRRTRDNRPDGNAYLAAPLNAVAEDLFECGWPTRTLAAELAGEIAWREDEAARRAFWEAHTSPDAESPWAWRRAVCNALAELGITQSVINRRKS